MRCRHACRVRNQSFCFCRDAILPQRSARASLMSSSVGRKDPAKSPRNFPPASSSRDLSRIVSRSATTCAERERCCFSARVSRLLLSDFGIRMVIAAFFTMCVLCTIMHTLSIISFFEINMDRWWTQQKAFQPTAVHPTSAKVISGHGKGWPTFGISASLHGCSSLSTGCDWILREVIPATASERSWWALRPPQQDRGASCTVGHHRLQKYIGRHHVHKPLA